jgi:hypothetical protein
MHHFVASKFLHEVALLAYIQVVLYLNLNGHQLLLLF